MLTSWGCCRTSLQTCYPKTTGIYSLVALEAEHLKSRFWQVMLPLKPPKEEPYCLFQLPMVASNLWCSLAHKCIMPISAFIFT